MKMITKIFVALFLISGFLFSGCEDFLDKQPVSQLSRDKYWKTAKDADIWMAAMYDGMQNTLSRNWYIWGEVRSDNPELSGTGTAQLRFLTNTITADMGECNWNELYRTISSTNFAIKYIPTIPDVIPQQVASQLAQAYTMRALMYFYAVRVWGPVPLITEPYEGLPGQERFLNRTEVAKVKEQILSDIAKALENFDNNTPSIYLLNRGSALALQTDVHMWFKEYDKAIASSDQLIALKKYSLVTKADDWKKMFVDPSTSTETILNMYWDFLQDGSNGLAAFYASGSNTPNYKSHRAVWDTLVSRHTDARIMSVADTVVLWYKGGKTKVTYEHYQYYDRDVPKFAPYNPALYNATYNYSGGFVYASNSESQTHIPLYRLADIMLLRAEALNKLGRAQEARDIVNNLRKRMGYNKLLTAVNTPDEASLENAILVERQLELWGEGKRWFDLVRTNKVTEIMDPIIKSRGIPEGFGDIRKILFPIHSSVFEANPNITQNEPYTQN